MKHNFRSQSLVFVALFGAALWLTSSPVPTVHGDDNENQPTLVATLTGAAIAGATPSGRSEYTVSGTQRELDVSVRANLPAGTALNVTVGGAAVGTITLNSEQRGALELDTEDGDTVPTIAAGAAIMVKNGTTTILSGAFAAPPPTPTPSPTGTPRPSPSPSPTGTPRPSPSPTATPGPAVRLFAGLTGPAIGGVTPNGRARFSSGGGDDGDGDSPASEGPELEAHVAMVNLPVDTMLDVVVGTTTVGQIRLRTSGRGEFEGNTTAVIAVGTAISVKNGTATILSGVFSATPPPEPTPTGTPRPSPTPAACAISLSAATYTVAENAGQLTVTVNRVCATPGTSRVEFESENGTASDRTDYTRASGRLDFAAGETSKTFAVLITNDTIVEPAETFSVHLEEAEGASLVAPFRAVVTINDNDVAGTGANPLETPQFFVQQHYADFLSRPADAAGLNYWSGQIAQCGADTACVTARRIGVSAAFFIEQEFGDTGYYIYRLYKASYGRQPVYAEFTPDRARIVGGATLEQSKTDFANDWVNRPAFISVYPDNLAPELFVNKLFDTAGLNGFAAERQAEIIAMYQQGRTRAQVLRNVIELTAFKTREYNPAFVQMQYFGYLRRDPDAGGYDFWLGILQQQPSNAHGMVCAFITSAEMQSRFSLNIPRSNSECR